MFVCISFMCLRVLVDLIQPLAARNNKRGFCCSHNMQSRGYVTVRCPYICLSHRMASARLPAVSLHRRYWSIAMRLACSSNCEQCHIVSWHRKFILGDRRHITKQPSVCFPVSIGRLEQKCIQLVKSSVSPTGLQCRQLLDWVVFRTAVDNCTAVDNN